MLVLVGAAVPAGAQQVAADGDGAPANLPVAQGGDDSVLTQRQERLGDVLEKVLPRIETLPGYVQLALDARNDRLIVLWLKGNQYDASLKTAVSFIEHEGAISHVDRRRYSAEQLVKGQKRIWARAGSVESGIAGVFSISSVEGLSLDRDGILVTGRAAPGRSDEARRQMGAIESELSALGGLDVSVSFDAPVPAIGVSSPALMLPQAGGNRQSPNVPYNGGAYMINSQGATCSSGFTVWYGRVKRTTTARHCTGTPYRARADANKGFGVTVTQPSNGRFGQSRLMFSQGDGYIFTGGYTSASTRTVMGIEPTKTSGLGALVCTEGGNSGEHCGLDIRSVNVLWNDGFGAVTTNRAVNTNSSTYAAIQGDSGGPVIALHTNSKAGIVGMIQALSGPVWTNCAGARDAGANQCSHNVLFTTATQVLMDIEASAIATG